MNEGEKKQLEAAIKKTDNPSHYLQDKRLERVVGDGRADNMEREEERQAGRRFPRDG